MTETFYRLHANPAAPCLCAEHAYSGLWGSAWSPDGTRTECQDCSQHDGSRDECRTCEGTGWEDAQYGYSACDSAEELIAYMREHGVPADDDPVVIFEGRRVGTGFDGETLAVPAGAVFATTWGALVAKVNA